MKMDLIVVYAPIHSSGFKVLDVFDERGLIEFQIVEQAASRFLTEDQLAQDPIHPVFSQMDLLKKFSMECSELSGHANARLMSNEELNQILLSVDHVPEFVEQINKNGQLLENPHSNNGKGLWGKLFN